MIPKLRSPSGRRLLWCGLLFVAILPPHGPYVLATVPLLLILIPFTVLSIWACMTPEAFSRLAKRALTVIGWQDKH